MRRRDPSSRVEVAARAASRAGSAGAIAVAGLVALTGCLAVESRRPADTAAARDSIRLSPDPAFAGARIAVVFADPAVHRDRYRFEWRRNGRVVAGVAGPELEPGLFARGDRIEVAAREAGAESGPGDPMRASVTVANSAPKVTRVTVMPSTESGRPVFLATPESLDPDGDPLTHAYRWFKNGAPLESRTGASLPWDGIAPADRIAVEVVASDGVDASPPARAEAAPIDNRPPRFTSQPAAPGGSDQRFQYQAVAIDDDGDPIRYELVSGPPGMAVTAEGQVSWALPAGDLRRGQHTVTIRARDERGGEATQQFAIHLGASPSRP